MTLIDGKKVSADVRAELKTETAAFETQYGKKVGLAVVLVGEDPASQVYVRNKIRGCEEAGIRSFVHYLPVNASQREVEELVSALAADDNVHGILVQLPLPKHLDEEKILACIPTAKDVDGFSAENIGRLAMNEEGTVACTPSGVMELLKRYAIDPRGKKAVVVGRSNIVGRPMALLRLNADATVTVCHTKTPDLRAYTADADIIIVAAGRPATIDASYVKDGAAVIDVGVNRVEDPSKEKGFRLVGDADYASFRDRDVMITPVPGGIGLMTVSMLMANTLEAARKRRGR